MTTNNIATKLLIVAFSAATELAWKLIKLGRQGYESRCPLVMSRLCMRLWLAGEALETWCDRTEARLGILDDVLERCAG